MSIKDLKPRKISLVAFNENAYSREKTTPIFMKGSSVLVVG